MSNFGSITLEFRSKSLWIIGISFWMVLGRWNFVLDGVGFQNTISWLLEVVYEIHTRWQFWSSGCEYLDRWRWWVLWNDPAALMVICIRLPYWLDMAGLMNIHRLESKQPVFLPPLLEFRNEFWIFSLLGRYMQHLIIHYKNIFLPITICVHSNIFLAWLQNNS